MQIENAYDDLGELHKKTLTIREWGIENQVDFGLVDDSKQLRATELYFIGILFYFSLMRPLDLDWCFMNVMACRDRS